MNPTDVLETAAANQALSPKLSKRTTPADILAIELPPNHGVMAIMNVEGDKKTIWDRNNQVEVEAAKREFEFFRSKGHMAYKVEGKEGTRGEILRDFDPAAERIIFAPPMRGGWS